VGEVEAAWDIKGAIWKQSSFFGYGFWWRRAVVVWASDAL